MPTGRMANSMFKRNQIRLCLVIIGLTLWCGVALADADVPPEMAGYPLCKDVPHANPCIVTCENCSGKDLRELKERLDKAKKQIEDLRMQMKLQDFHL